MLQNLCIMLKFIPNKLKQTCKIDYLFEILADLWFIFVQKLSTGLFYAKDRIECFFYSIQVNILLEYLDPVTVLLKYIDGYSSSLW